MIFDRVNDQWEGWPFAAEPEFAEFCASLIKLTQPYMVVETGMGTGAISKAVAPLANSLICYETDESFWRNLPEGAQLKGGELLELDAFDADLLILDSLPIKQRIREFETWVKWGVPGSVVLVHDAEPKVQPSLVEAIQQSGVSGVFLEHPACSFVGQL